MDNAKDIESVKFYYGKIIDGMLKKEKELLLGSIEMQKKIKDMQNAIDVLTAVNVDLKLDIFRLKLKLDSIKNRRIYKLLKFLKVWG